MKRAPLLVLLAAALLVAAPSCGGALFPKCDDPLHPCPPVEPDYPARAAGDAGRSDGAR